MPTRSQKVELYDRIARGEEDLTLWDTEELMRGYRRAADGTFRGRPPKFVPQPVHEELARRVKRKAEHEFLSRVGEVQEVWLDIARGDFDPDHSAKAGTMLKAATKWIERALGAEPQKVEVRGTMRHEQVFEDVVVDRSGFDDEDADDVIDAELVDADEDES